MGKNKKIFNKKRRNAGKSDIKKKKSGKDDEFVNKKALFNRYKDKQKVEEELAKKKQFERKLQQKQVVHSESDSEEDFYGQLLLSLNNGVKRKFTVCSEDESTSGEESEGENDKKNIAEDIDVKTREMDVQDSDSNKEDNEDTDESDSENEQEVSHDPFVQHLQYELSDELLVSLTNPSNTVKTITKHWPILGNFIVTLPQPLVTLTKNKKVKLLELLEEKNKKYAPTGTVPHTINSVDFNNLHIKSQIHGTIVSANKNNLIKRDLELNEVFTPLQKELFSIINNYQDLLYTERTFTNADEIRYTYCLHVVNHMLKTRTKIIHHNAKLAKATDVTEEYRDQGLVRPKVVIMVPFKDAAYRVVNTLIDILMPKEAGKVVNRKRFQEDFTGGELKMPKKNPKPEDYELLFSGNTDDTFRMGLTLTKKSLKLYTDFYGSDIIIASPLGLRILVGAEGDEDRDFDFLASIELLVMDQVDVFFMQNWEHVLHLLDHFHLQPKTLHGTDISRIRTWAANGWSKYYRQTLMFSSVPLPEISNIMNRRCNNYAGRVIVANPIYDGAMEEVLVQIPHYFHRFEADSPAASPEARLQCFIRDVLPLHRDSMMSHTLIYVPSYYDYVRVRNYLKREDITFVQICEYSKDSKIARARDMFFHTEAPLLLYSERAHFFRRFNLKGIRHIIFYQLPTYPHFYSEMCNLMQEHNQNKYGGSALNMSVRVLYCKAYDMTRACGVVGASRLPTLMDEGTRLHTFRTSRS